MPKKNRVAYFYDNALGNFYFGKNHPMKPPRLAMTHHLVLAYQLHEKMDIYKPREATPTELAAFHSPSYIDFLHEVTVENQDKFEVEMQRFGLDWDCPVFDGMSQFCSLYTGASIEGAHFLNNGEYDIAINWSGGLHHAKKQGASGFCYVNDLVLSILELLKHHPRVLYVDIDVHHGDGVEEAFYTYDRFLAIFMTNVENWWILLTRVFTVSFHKFGENFFPGTGRLTDIGESLGRYHSLNIPFKDGVDDACFHMLFKPIISEVLRIFNPTAIVMQCGADSLAKDRLGVFNLSLKGHAEAVKFMKSFGIPLLITGGGGYTKSNVAKCWAYETSVLLDVEVEDHIPPNRYYDYYMPDYNINIDPNKYLNNQNTISDLERIKEKAFEYLRNLSTDSSVHLQRFPPKKYIGHRTLDNEDIDISLKQYIWQHLRNRDQDEDFLQ